MKLREANKEKSKEVFEILKKMLFSKEINIKDEDRIPLIAAYFKDLICEGETNKLDIRTIREETNHFTLMEYALDIASSERNLVVIRSLLRVGVGVDYDHLNFLLEREGTDKTFMNKLRSHSEKTKEITELFNKDPENNGWVEKIEEILNIIESNETAPEIKEMSKELLSDVINSIYPMELQKSEAISNLDQKQSETVSNLDQKQSEEEEGGYILNFLKNNKNTPRINSLKERIDSIFTDPSLEVDQTVNEELVNLIEKHIEAKKVKNLEAIFDKLSNLSLEFVVEKNIKINWEKIFESAAHEYDPEIFTCCIDGRVKCEKVLHPISEAERRGENLLEHIRSEKKDLTDKLIEQPIKNDPTQPIKNNPTQHIKNEDFDSLVDSLDVKTKVLDRLGVIDKYELLPQIEKLHGKGAVENLLIYLDSTKETPNASLSSHRTEKKQGKSISNKL